MASTALFLAYSWAVTFSSFLAKKVGLCLSKGVNGVILNKVLALSHKSLSDCSQGKLLSLIAQDSEFVTQQFSQILEQPAGIFGLVASALVLFHFVNLVALTSLVLMLSTLVLARLFRDCRTRFLRQEEAFADSRIKLIADMIAGIRTIKAYAWERVFERKIAD